MEIGEVLLFLGRQAHDCHLCDLKNLVRIECVTQSVTDVVDTQDGQKNHEPRDDGSPGSGKYLIERILEHVTPGRRRRLNAET